MDFNEVSPSLEVSQTNGFDSDFGWSIGSDVIAMSISRSNAVNHVIDRTGTPLLGTLQFTLDARSRQGRSSIALTFDSTQRNQFDATPVSLVTVMSGALSLDAVPEPGSSATVGLAALGARGLHRRRWPILSSR